jgi:hypothetical protein
VPLDFQSMISIKFVTPLSSQSEGPMQRSLAAGAVLSLAFLTFALTQNSATPAADVLVLEQNGDTLRWQQCGRG